MIPPLSDNQPMPLEGVDAIAPLLHRAAEEAERHAQHIRRLHMGVEESVGEPPDRADVDMVEARAERLRVLADQFQTARDGDAQVRVIPRGMEVRVMDPRSRAEVGLLLPADAEVVAKALLALGKAGFGTVR